MAGSKLDEFGKSSTIRQTKVVVTINNPLADLFILQTFIHQMLEKTKLAKHSPYQTLPLYSNCNDAIYIVLNNLQSSQCVQFAHTHHPEYTEY